MKAQRYLLVHDGTFEGDNVFYVPGTVVSIPQRDLAVRIRHGRMTVGHLRAMYLESYEKRLRATETAEKPEVREKMIRDELAVAKAETVPKIKGAWIVDERTLRVLNILWEADTRNDSEAYLLNHTAKVMADSLALGRIGVLPR